MVILYFCPLYFYSCISVYTYWEDYTKQEQERMLYALPDNTDLKAVYFGDYTLTDDDKSNELLKKMCILYNDNDRMFKFHLLNKILTNSDGALGEMVSFYCLQFFNENTNYVLNYFERDNCIKEIYAYYIAAELYYEGIDTNKYKSTIIKNTKIKEKEMFKRFLDDVEQQYLSINH
jgi:hypothetical protein